MITKKLPKVAIIAPVTFDFPPKGYGPWELAAYNIAEGLVDLGVDVTVYATKKAKTRAKLRYILPKPLSQLPREDDFAASRIHPIYALRDAKHFDVIHNHVNIEPVVYGQLINTPMVTSLLGAASEKANSMFYDFVREGAKFISVSDSERSFRPDLNYVRTIYHGVDFRKYKLNKKPGDYLAFTGRMVKDKGILSAIRISKATGIPLKMAGIITDQKFFDKEVAPHIDGKNIQFLGNLSYKPLAHMLSNALGFIGMVEWNDPCPISVIDALASGVPVIGGTHGALKEMVYHESMGFIAKNVRDAVSKIDRLRKIDREECQEFARKRFSREVCAKAHLETYLELV